MNRRPHQQRERNGNWKGGRTVTPDGYVLIMVGFDHHLADVRGYAYEHRLVMEKKLGRRLKPGEEVHHDNDNRADNKPGNLKLARNKAEHRFFHRGPNSKLRRPGEPNRMIRCACGCGTRFRKYDGEGRPRKYVTGHNTRTR